MLSDRSYWRVEADRLKEREDTDRARRQAATAEGTCQ